MMVNLGEFILNEKRFKIQSKRDMYIELSFEWHRFMLTWHRFMLTAHEYKTMVNYNTVKNIHSYEIRRRICILK
jgi:hypothetical protein